MANLNFQVETAHTLSFVKMEEEKGRRRRKRKVVVVVYKRTKDNIQSSASS